MPPMAISVPVSTNPANKTKKGKLILEYSAEPTHDPREKLAYFGEEGIIPTGHYSQMDRDVWGKRRAGIWWRKDIR